MYYNKENVERLRQRYPEGTRICLDRMNDDPFPVESGTLDMVDHVDDAGTLHCIFDNGRTLGVIPGVDDFHVISKHLRGQPPSPNTPPVCPKAPFQANH